jgi:hypothetical protein
MNQSRPAVAAEYAVSEAGAMNAMSDREFLADLAREVIDDPGDPDSRAQATVNVLAAIAGQLGRIAIALERMAPAE